jgi:hypothetical protein
VITDLEFVQTMTTGQKLLYRLNNDKVVPTYVRRYNTASKEVELYPLVNEPEEAIALGLPYIIAQSENGARSFKCALIRTEFDPARFKLEEEK